jgi:1-acyl-sn-glycerol-3-phosphate acyltransferase
VALRALTSGLAATLSWFLANLLLLFIVLLGAVAENLFGSRAQVPLRRMTSALVRQFFVGLLPLFRLYRIMERPEAWPTGPALLVANHRSWLDALLILGFVPGVVVPVSSRYLRLPLLGRLMRWLGCVPLDEKSPAVTAASLRRLDEQLHRGAIVAVFPEGTRKGPGELGGFSDVFFRLAIDTGTPIFPLMLHCRPLLFGPVSPFFIGSRTASFRMRLGSAMVPHPQDRASDLARRARKWLRAELEPLDAGET